MPKSLSYRSSLALLLLTALPQLTQAGAADGLDANRRISNGVLSVGISAHYAGAVSSIVYNGMELVNNYDHGRQLQVAWNYHGVDESYNPTEAGSAADAQQATSTSRPLKVQAGQRTLTTESHPAYWNSPGRGRNTASVTNDLLKKTISLNFSGDPHVMAFDTEISLSPELTGPPISSLSIEAPTLYAAPELSSHYRFDLRNGKIEPVASRPKLIASRMNERIREETDRQTMPILATPNGRHAVGFYALTTAGFWSYYSWDVPSEIPQFACNKLTAFYRHPAKAGEVYRYRTLVIIGSLETVKTSAAKLRGQGGCPVTRDRR